MKTEEIRTKTVSELKDLLLKSKKEAMNLRFQKVNGQLESVSRAKAVRRLVAQIKTELTSKASNAAKPTKTTKSKARS
jgi:large subunit ribosomal protein L29